jgi:hypothetical protein
MKPTNKFKTKPVKAVAADVLTIEAAAAQFGAAIKATTDTAADIDADAEKRKEALKAPLFTRLAEIAAKCPGVKHDAKAAFAAAFLPAMGKTHTKLVGNEHYYFDTFVALSNGIDEPTAPRTAQGYGKACKPVMIARGIFPEPSDAQKARQAGLDKAKAEGKAGRPSKGRPVGTVAEEREPDHMAKVAAMFTKADKSARIDIQGLLQVFTENDPTGKYLLAILTEAALSKGWIEADDAE